MSWVRISAAVLLLAGLAADAPRAQTAIRYRFSFPEPQHRWMQVEIAYSGLANAPLELRMSRSSPGRYSLHEFAKNVYDVQATAGDGRELRVDRPDPDGWSVAGQAGNATIRYKGWRRCASRRPKAMTGALQRSFTPDRRPSTSRRPTFST
jgi:hypothetical protein